MHIHCIVKRDELVYTLHRGQTLTALYALQVIRAETLYWKADDPDLFSSTSFPVFGSYAAEFEGKMFDAYGIPIHEYPGLVKVSKTSHTAWHCHSSKV